MEYKNTLNLPQTDFPMRAGLVQREPEQLGRMHGGERRRGGEHGERGRRAQLHAHLLDALAQRLELLRGRAASIAPPSCPGSEATHGFPGPGPTAFEAHAWASDGTNSAAVQKKKVLQSSVRSRPRLGLRLQLNLNVSLRYIRL